MKGFAELVKYPKDANLPRLALVFKKIISTEFSISFITLVN